MIRKLIIALFLLFSTINIAHAENFYIENYDINLNVKEDRTVQIQENIDTFFKASSHGIYRKIPIINKISRINGSKEIVEAKISNIRVSEQASEYSDDYNYTIKIGDPNKLISGKHFYRIKYDYKLIYNANEFYFNIIGNGWDTNIDKFHFIIKMPKDFDYDKVGISVGKYGKKGFSGDIEYRVNPKTNTIEGWSKRPLNNNEAVTIRVQVPEGYFLKVQDNKTPVKSLCFTIIIILTSLSVLKWYKIGKDDKVIPVVNFYPPKGLNSAVVGMIYKGKAEIEHVTSLIIYLANKGYLKIKGDGDYFEIEKLKNYDGENTACKILMSALFRSGDSNKATSQDLKYSKTFYKECEDIVDNLNDIGKNLYNKESISFSSKITPIISLAVISIITILGILNFNLPSVEQVFTMPFFIIGATVFFSFMFSKNSIATKIFITIWASGFCGIPLSILLMTQNFYHLSKNIPLIITGIIGLIITAICLIQMPKRNIQGTRILGAILGFKKFLETAEASRIRALAKENPMYCFDMLSYAFVLGVYEGWIDKIQGIMTNNPQWWEGSFNPYTFSKTMGSINSASSPSVSNGGVSHSSSGGGGGHSGGGGGGGGGGSW